MLDMPGKKIPFTEYHQQLLRELTITNEQPGTILHDFDIMLDVVREHPQQLTPAHVLTLDSIRAINPRLKHPLEIKFKRESFKMYPNIQGLYLLLRASGLSKVRMAGKKPMLEIDEGAYQQWQQMNSTERYGNLLEVWMLRANPEIIGGYSRSWSGIPDTFDNVIRFYFTRLKTLGSEGSKSNMEAWRFIPGFHNLALLDLFGWIRIEHGDSLPEQGWQVKQITPTPVGDAFLGVLSSIFADYFARLYELRFYDDNADETSQFGSFKAALQPYFPAWQKTFSLAETVFRAGTYTFKVSFLHLKQVWRRIAIGAESSLDVLAQAILRAVKFDNDHMYRFSYRDSYVGTTVQINHQYLKNPPSTSDVRVGDIPLEIGQSMIFLFDFGDDWEFEVLLEQVDTNKTTKRPKVLEEHGEPPPQYPNWDYDDDDV